MRVRRAIWNDLMPYSPVFTTAGVAEVTGTDPSNVSRDLARLEEAGFITRVRRGLWAIVNHPDFSPYAVVPHLFSGGGEGYVSLLSALNLHGMIEQIPRVVHVVTTMQRPRLVTPVGVYEFHQIQMELFEGFGPYRRTGNFDIATPEKAVFDALYLSTRKAQRFSSLPEVEITIEFAPEQIEAWIARIRSEPLRIGVRDRWRAFSGRASIAETV